MIDLNEKLRVNDIIREVGNILTTGAGLLLSISNLVVILFALTNIKPLKTAANAINYASQYLLNLFNKHLQIEEKKKD